MRVEGGRVEQPWFSICIPQYNRTAFLLEGLRSLTEQTFRNFEVCIADDRSTDGRQAEVVDYLRSSGLAFVYQVQARNVRYDANLRTAINLARGKYCLLLGNDDALAGPDALAGLTADMQAHQPAGVVITDFQDFDGAQRAGRIRRTSFCGSGPRVAAAHFRDFSFVSGVLVERSPAQELATDRWDGSEMYQTFIGCRMIASGVPLLELERVLVRKDIRISGQSVDSYAARPRLQPCPIVERRLPLSVLGRLTADATRPYANGSARQALTEHVLLQLLLFTYPFWIIEYRRVQSWRYALGICLGMRPEIITEGMELSRTRRLRLAVVYAMATVGGLCMPVRLFRSMQRRLYTLAKSAFARLRRPALAQESREVALKSP